MKDLDRKLKELTRRSAKDGGRTPVAWGYCRVSHADGFQKNESVPAQADRIKQYYERELKPKGIDFGAIEDDGTNVSAFKVSFRLRPAGRKLLAQMQDGDHLVLDKVDRIWRSIDDFCDLIRKFDKKGITIHIVSFLGQSIQSNSPMGDFMLRLFVMVAQLESEIKGERIGEALYVRRTQGRAHSYVPPGCFVHTVTRGGKAVKLLRWSEVDRTIMDKIVSLIDTEKLKWEEAFPRIEAFCAEVEQRPVQDREHWPIQKWRRFYMWETAYRFLKIENTCDIPPKRIIREAARQWKRHRTEERKSYRADRSTIEKITREQLLGLMGGKYHSDESAAE